METGSWPKQHPEKGSLVRLILIQNHALAVAARALTQTLAMTFDLFRSFIIILMAVSPMLPLDAHPDHIEDNADSSINYLGETFIFKHESKGYNREQATRACRLLSTAPAPRFLETYAELIDTQNTLNPPQVGCSTGGFGDHTSLGQFTYISMGFPGRNEYRVFVYQAEEANARYRFIEEFRHYNRYPPSLDFIVENGRLACRNGQGETLRTFKLPSAPLEATQPSSQERLK